MLDRGRLRSGLRVDPAHLRVPAGGLRGRLGRPVRITGGDAMGFPAGCPVIDTMIGFPHEGFRQYDFIRRQTRDRSSREEMEFPVEYMFKQVPKDLPTDDPISVTLGEMDKYGIELGLIGVGDETSRAALKQHPDRFIPSGSVPDPNDVT